MTELRTHELHVRLTTFEPVLGSWPADPELYRSYIESKAPPEERVKIEDEVAVYGVDGVADSKMTVFPKLADGTPFAWDYQIRGHFKAAASALRKVPGSRSTSLKAFKKVIDQLVFIEPRKIPYRFTGGIQRLERPLRASTPQGDRVCLACSEMVPGGAVLEFTVSCLCESDLDYVREWLDYGRFNGLGQWRNSGMGRFTWEELDAAPAYTPEQTGGWTSATLA